MSPMHLKEIDPGVILTLPWGYLFVHDHYSQTVIGMNLRSLVSGERLHYHWSSGFQFYKNLGYFTFFGTNASIWNNIWKYM